MDAENNRQLIISHFDLIKNPRKGFQEISSNIRQFYNYINPLVETSSSLQIFNILIVKCHDVSIDSAGVHMT